MRTIKKLEEDKEKLLGEIKLLATLDQTPQISLKIKTIRSAINVIDVKIQTLNKVLEMMSNDMQFIGAGESEKQLRENITGESRHQGYVTGN